jgi:hypothetical protein
MTSLLFPDAQIDAIAAQAKTALPAAINGRLEKAIRLVRSGSVELHADGSAVVISESDGLTGYLIANGRCTCPDFQFQPSEVAGWCCHKIARALVLRLQRHALAPTSATREVPTGDENGTRCENASTEPSGEPRANLRSSEQKNGVSVPPEYVVWIQNKPFVKFAGLLQMAHAQHLVELSESWTYTYCMSRRNFRGGMHLRVR